MFLFRQFTSVVANWLCVSVHRLCDAQSDVCAVSVVRLSSDRSRSHSTSAKCRTNPGVWRIVEGFATESVFS